MKFTVTLILIAGVGCTFAAPASESAILKSFDTKTTVNILISFKAANTAEIRQRQVTLNIVDKAQRTQSLYDSLKIHADETQSNILDILSNHRIIQNQNLIFHQLWITNQISIKHADKQLVEALLQREEVSTITEEKLVPLEEPIDKVEHPVDYVPQAGEQWGVIAIDAPAVWATGNRGKGVVIANIDSGVRGTHEALKDGFRRLNGWFDADKGTAEPADDYGHGTHTMGTMVGRTNGIGVAPEAEWIACRACTDFCSNLDFILCGQWALCPTDASGNNPRCDLAPHAVSNSWGMSYDDTWYDEVLTSWIYAGIAPIFSLGNSGTSCTTANSPGDSPLAIGIGATTSNNQLASYSSVGPTGSGLTKPDLAAPGSSVYSSYNSNDRSYSTMSGTSMASPHVAGLTALLYHINANLTVPQIRGVLTLGAQPVKPLQRTCGGISDSTYPNNHVGAGVINAPRSVELVQNMLNN